MLEVYDVWHHSIPNSKPFSSVHTYKKSRCFQKSPLWRALLKRCVFGDRFTALVSVCGRLNRRKKISVLKQKWIRVNGALDKQNNNFARALDISLPSLHDYDVKLLNFTFNGECERKTTTFLFFLLNWDTDRKNSTREKFSNIWQI